MRPTNLLLFSCGVWLLLFVVAPVSPSHRNFLAEASIIAGLLAMFAGAYLGERASIHRGTSRHVAQPSLRKMKSMYNLTLALGLLGILMRAYDWFVLRGVALWALFLQTEPC